MEKVKLAVLLFSTLFVGYGLLGGLMERASAGDDSYSDLSMFTEILDHVRDDYVEEPNLEKALKGALQGMMEALDPFSSYVDASIYEELKERSEEGTIGATVSKRYGYAYVVSVIPGSPAEKSGLRTGDLFESIEGKPAALMSAWEAQRSMYGAPGSTLKARVIRNRLSEPQELEIVREQVPTPGVTAELTDDNLGVLRIPVLSEGNLVEIRSKVKMLLATGAMGILIDLRHVADGSLSEAIGVADLFLEKGETIAKVVGTQGAEQVYASMNAPLVRGVPVVVLADGGTSGPAEVLAAALVDQGVAKLVGQRTNGHGSLQETLNLQDGSVLIISTRLIYRPSGEPLQRPELRETGLEPDILAPERDFVSNFYFENTPEDGDSDHLNESFYSRLEGAVEAEQLEQALRHLRDLVQDSAEKVA